MELSIIIPCFNESQGIDHLGSRMRDLEEKLSVAHELIFVDDGSMDSTYSQLAHRYKDRIGRDVKIVKHSENRGVGAALKTGILNSNGHYVAVIDSDCTYDPSYLVNMLDMVKKEKADIVTASPYHPEGRVINVPFYRLFLSRTLSKLYNIISNGKFYTYTSMFRIYRRAAIENVDFKSNRFLAMAEILIRSLKQELKIIEFPATLKGRIFGTSSSRTLKLITEHICFIIKLLLTKELR